MIGVNVFFFSLALLIYCKRKRDLFNFHYRITSNCDSHRFDICKVIQQQYQSIENPDVVTERSIIQADFYAKRFKQFLFEHVFHPFSDTSSRSSIRSSSHQYQGESNRQNTPLSSFAYPQIPSFQQ